MVLDKDRKQSGGWDVGAILPRWPGCTCCYAMVFHPVQDTGVAGIPDRLSEPIGSVLLEANWRTPGYFEIWPWPGLPPVLALALDAAIGLFRRGVRLPPHRAADPRWLLRPVLVYVGIQLGYGYLA